MSSSGIVLMINVKWVFLDDKKHITKNVSKKECNRGMQRQR